LRVTMSLGVAVSHSDGVADAQALLQAADTALYRAKERGRNCVELATPSDIPPILAATGPTQVGQRT